MVGFVRDASADKENFYIDGESGYGFLNELDG